MGTQKTTRTLAQPAGPQPDWAPHSNTISRSTASPQNLTLLMIGFSEDLLEDLPRQDEGPETRSLSKKELYNLVALSWMLPPFNSKGITREYLLKVLRNEVFRIDTKAWRTFEYELMPHQQKRTAVINNSLMVQKLTVMLSLTGNKPLGFSTYDPPDQNWLYKVARFVDVANFMEAFEAKINDPPAVNEASHNIEKLQHCRREVSKYLFNDTRVRNNKKVWDALRSLSESFRTLTSYQATMRTLQFQLQHVIDKVHQAGINMAEWLDKAARVYTIVQDPDLRAEHLLDNRDDLDVRLHHKAQDFKKL